MTTPIDIMAQTRPLGIMRPLGGGDPIPLKKPEIVVGRRAACDIRLDFENISGKHSQLRFVNGVWHVRDLNSTNGTTVNGQPVFSEHGVMPDDELSFAGHSYMIDYDPIAPTSLLDANQILEDEISESEGRRRSLMEMAGLSTDSEFSLRRVRGHRSGSQAAQRSAVPDDLNEPLPDLKEEERVSNVSDDEFLELIRNDIEKNEQGKP
jgi:hypothetical protein